jgi:hypothetical protein
VVSSGYQFGNVRCEADLFSDSIYDYTSDATGYRTVEQAIEAFQQTEADWQLRNDWHDLTLSGDMSSAPVEFNDERGWVYLSIDLQQVNGGWLVTYWASCSPIP